jgi:steroid delta-isomerase-like uncharacterized protein
MATVVSLQACLLRFTIVFGCAALMLSAAWEANVAALSLPQRKLGVREIVLATVEAWNSHRLDALREFFDEQVTLERPGLEKPLRGRDAYFAFDSDYLAAFPDATIEVRSIVVERDLAVHEFIMRGHQRGVFRGAPPTGKQIAIPVVEVLRFKNNRIAEVRRYLDPSLYDRQLK